MLTVRAPAKINLTLEVLGRRGDGFHEVRSLIQAIDLCDRLHFKSGTGVEFSSTSPGWQPEISLVSKAVRLLQEVTGCRQGGRIEVEKVIPLLSGLGGDSSDAAAVLQGLNQFWALGLSRSDLEALATRLGSDVAFFLYGGTALLSGRGEVVTPLSPLPQRWLVVVVLSAPRLTGKTGELYARLKPEHFTDGRMTQHLADALAEDRFSADLLFNTFENVASATFPDIDYYREQLSQAGAANVHLAGSGPALFSLFSTKAEAESSYGLLLERGIETYLTATLSH